MRFFRDVAGVLVAVVAMIGLGIAPAWADSVHIGGTENITNEGGAGGAGGSAAAAAAAAASATGVGIVKQEVTQVGIQDVKVKNEQAQGQLQGQKQGQKQQVRDSGNSTVQIEGDRTEIPAQAPAIFAPNLTSSPEACMGSVSAGGGAGFGGTSFGITFGTTWTNDQCQDRMNARTLGSLGQNQAALEYLAAANPKIADALKKAGVKTASVEITVPDPTRNTPLASAVPQGGTKVEKRDVAVTDGPTCGDGKPAKLRSSGFYSCYGWDR